MPRSHFEICKAILVKTKDMPDIEERAFGGVTARELAWLAADAIMECPECKVDLSSPPPQSECSMCEYINAILGG